MTCERPQCYGVEQRKARRRHRCCECEGWIEPGETYHYHHGVWDGEGSDYKVCVECENLRGEVNASIQSFEDMCPFTCLEEFVREIARDDPTLLARFNEIQKKRKTS